MSRKFIKVLQKLIITGSLLVSQYSYSKDNKSPSSIEIGSIDYEKIYVLDGRFSEIVLKGNKVDEQSPKLASFAFKHGTSLVLSLENGNTISFFSGSMGTPEGTGVTNYSIDHITFTEVSDAYKKGFSKMTSLYTKSSIINVKKGRCLYSNPFIGKKVKFECEANTKKGLYQFKFTSNGKSPGIIDGPNTEAYKICEKIEGDIRFNVLIENRCKWKNEHSLLLKKARKELSCNVSTVSVKVQKVLEHMKNTSILKICTERIRKNYIDNLGLTKKKMAK